MDDAREPRGCGRVILYTEAGCVDSARVRARLVDRGVVFVERDVTDDVDVARSLYATGTFATPLLVVGNRTVLGFRPDEIAVALSV